MINNKISILATTIWPEALWPAKKQQGRPSELLLVVVVGVATTRLPVPYIKCI
jgi:hypothetical protein